MKKICKICNKEKELNEFYKQPGGKFGVKACCKECMKSTNVKEKERLYKLNKQRCVKCGKVKFILEFNKQSNCRFGIRNICKSCQKLYYIKNKENNKKKKHDYYLQHKKSILLKSLNWKQNNPKKFIETRRKYEKQKRDTDVNFRLAKSLRLRVRDVLKGRKKSKPTLKMLDCTVEELKQHLQSQFTKGMSWNNYGRGKGKWCIDHIHPCSKFDLSKKSEQLKCFNYTNLQPLWFEDNVRKSNKLIYA